MPEFFMLFPLTSAIPVSCIASFCIRSFCALPRILQKKYVQPIIENESISYVHLSAAVSWQEHILERIRQIYEEKRYASRRITDTKIFYRNLGAALYPFKAGISICPCSKSAALRIEKYDFLYSCPLYGKKLHWSR